MNTATQWMKHHVWPFGNAALEAAQEVICQAAIVLNRDILHWANFIEIMPGPQYYFGEDLIFRVPEKLPNSLGKAWHDDCRRRNAYCHSSIPCPRAFYQLRKNLLICQQHLKTSFCLKHMKPNREKIDAEELVKERLPLTKWELTPKENEHFDRVMRLVFDAASILRYDLEFGEDAIGKTLEELADWATN